MLSFRFASIGDLKEISEIENESFENPFNETQLIYEIKENPFSKYLLALDDDKIVGFINFWITFDSATINQIAVKKEARNSGIGTKLIIESEKILKENSVEFYTLEVRKSNEPAINLYKKCGFCVVSTKNSYYEDGEDALYMVKGEI